jgi:hypothetical protein
MGDKRQVRRTKKGIKESINENKNDVLRPF